jgi:hypothetical protein
MSNLSSFSRIEMARKVAVLPGKYQTAVPANSWKLCDKLHTNYFCAQVGTGGGYFECGNELSGSTKCEEFLN